jgi:hypothetical protein
MTILHKKWLSVASGAALLCLLAGGLATARYVSHKSAGNSTVSAASDATAAHPAAPDVNVLTVPAGTPIRIQLDQSLDSGRNNSGDVFDAHVVEPVVMDNTVVIPEGAPIRGRVEGARPSGHFRHPGLLEISLTEVKLDNDWHEIATRENNRRGTGHKKNNFTWIGGGAGGGTLIGALAAGGKGALIGGPVGAGAGTIAAFFTGKRNVHLPAETQLVFHLSEPLSVSPKG